MRAIADNFKVWPSHNLTYIAYLCGGKYIILLTVNSKYCNTPTSQLF